MMPFDICLNKVISKYSGQIKVLSPTAAAVVVDGIILFDEVARRVETGHEEVSHRKRNRRRRRSRKPQVAAFSKGILNSTLDFKGKANERCNANNMTW